MPGACLGTARVARGAPDLGIPGAGTAGARRGGPARAHRVAAGSWKAPGPEGTVRRGAMGAAGAELALRLRAALRAEEPR